MKPTSNSIMLSSEYKLDSRIGALMLASGKISPKSAENIVRTQEELGLRFGEAAVFLGLVTESDIQHYLAQQFDYPYLQKGEKNFSSHLVAAYDPFSPEVETFRAIRSQLMMSWFSQGHKALVILGVEPGDGASLFAANLAVVFSQLGENTLLVDANLRTPSQQKIFNLEERRGLSDILAGRAEMDVISRIEPFNELSILNSGTLPPNPQELLSRASFKSVKDQLDDYFDIVLYDVSSFSSASDVLAIAARVGGVLIVARKDKTKLNHIDAMAKKITASGAEVVGSVLVEF